MFDNLTDHARVVLLLAHEEVLRLGHEHTDSEHVLLALLYEGGPVLQVLKNMGVSMLNVRREVNKSIKYQYTPLRSKPMSLSPSIERILEIAQAEVQYFQHKLISTEHLFLAIMKERECTAARILAGFGLDFAVLRQRTIEMMVDLPAGEAELPQLHEKWFQNSRKKEKTFCTFEKQILCLLSHVPYMESKEFLAIYESRNFSPQYIRNTLSKMKKDGYIDAPERSAYVITTLGLNCLRSLNYKPLQYKQNWDNTWYMLAFEIPENQRSIRDSFRADLIRLGFGLLYNAVYISPWNYEAEVIELAKHYGILSQVTMLSGTSSINSLTRDKAHIIWKLDTIAAIYLEKQRWFRQEFLPAAERLSEKTSPLDLFIHYLNLGDHLCELSIVDPVLPKALLPIDWPGERVHDELGAALNQFIDRIANQAYYGRFVK